MKRYLQEVAALSIEQWEPNCAQKGENKIGNHLCGILASIGFKTTFVVAKSDSKELFEPFLKWKSY